MAICPAWPLPPVVFRHSYTLLALLSLTKYTIAFGGAFDSQLIFCCARHTTIALHLMTTSSRIRYQVGHIHSHQYRGHTNTLLLPKDKKDDGLRITEIGLYVNLSMVITKGLGGYVFNSRGKNSITSIRLNVHSSTYSAFRRFHTQPCRPHH